MQKRPLVPASPASRAGLRRFLYFTAAATGAAIMIVEILGAKMLAPFLGTSHFVWTAQIGVTLVALAAGYYAGGALADRSPRLGWLYGAILAAAVYLALTVLVVDRVAGFCLGLDLALGSLLASSFLFFVPLALLATTCPFLIRVLADSLAGVGGSVGRLSAVSTLGSVAGTGIIGYAVIPFLPNSVTLAITAGLLAALAGTYFLVWGRSAAPRAAIAAALLVGTLLAGAGVHRDLHPRFEGAVEVFRANSDFGMLQVLEARGGGKRFYLNDYLTQNTYDPDQGKSLSAFTYMLHGLARAYTSRIDDALCIGLGVGLVPMDFVREGVRVQAVEINPAVVPLARRWFGLEPEKMALFLGDGRHFINRSQERYDVIVLDAFLGDSSPSHLLTREAFAGMKRLLRPEGTLVINTFGEFTPGRDFFSASVEKTLRAEFASVLIHTAGGGSNVYFVASARPDLAPVRPFDHDRVHSALKDVARRAFEGLRKTDPRHGAVLTDDFNPVEFHDARNREDWRRQMAFGMRSL